jgi:bacterioferritin-associated ferredoxin
VRFSLLILLAGAAAGQTTQPFSHELHLKLPAKLACVTCHATVQSSTRLEDNNLPPVAICLGCHKEASVGEPRKTILARFDHKRHLAMGNIAPVIGAAIDSKNYLGQVDDIRRHLDSANQCAACHRGMEESVAPARADLPQMADCLVCHNKIDNPFSCEFCHAKGAALKPASHAPDFLDTHTRKDAKFDKESCAVCHGRKFQCLGCHS